MAITLQLTDGTQTIDFNDGTSLRLGNAFQQNTGGGSVTELVICGWLDSVTADSKAAKLRDITQLIRKGVRHFRNRHIDRAVWLVWKPDSATGTQYAKVMGGGVVEVDTNTIGGRTGGVLQVEIVREGFWRSMAPDGTAGTEVLAAATIYNKSDTDGDNWVSVAARDIDAPGLLQFDINAAQGYQKVLIARKIGTTADLNLFNPHFNPNDNSSSTATTADSAAPEDLKIQWTASGGVSWDISNTNFPGYVGRYAVYCWIKQISGAGSATIYYDMSSPSTQTGPTVTVSGSVGKTYLGTLTFPGNTMYNPFYDVTATGIVARISLTPTITGTATVDFYGLWLVPLDFPPFEVNDANDFNSNYNQWVDGVTQQVYEIDSSGDFVPSGDLTTQGLYPVLEPNVVNRFYFFFEDGNDHEFNDSFTVAVDSVDRFETLRGGA